MPSPGRGASGWSMPHPRASKSWAGISLGLGARQEQHTGARGIFASSACDTIAQGPLPLTLSLALPRLPSPWPCPTTCQGGPVDHLNSSGNEWLVPEPLVGAALCREVWEQPLWGSWTRVNPCLSAHSGKPQLEKSSSCLPAASEPQAPGPGFASVQTFVHPPWPAGCIELRGAYAVKSMAVQCHEQALPALL